MTYMDDLRELKKLTERIGDHPFTSKLTTERDSYILRERIPMKEIIAGSFTAPDDYVQLMVEVQEFTNSKLSTEKGHVSDFYFFLVKYGYVARKRQMGNPSSTAYVLLSPRHRWCIFY